MHKHAWVIIIIDNARIKRFVPNMQVSCNRFNMEILGSGNRSNSSCVILKIVCTVTIFYAFMGFNFLCIHGVLS